MSPLGKLTLALIGLRLWGVDGFVWGLFLGHMLIDKTYIIRSIETQMVRVDDIIRVKLPYKYYRYYNRLDGNIWGKLWGVVLGLILFGFWGFVILFILGQVIFDMPKNPDIRRIKKKTDHFFDNNWGKILGAIIGFVLESPLLIFIGLILGFVADYQRLEGAKLIQIQAISKYFQKINPLKLWRHAQGGEHRKYVDVMAALAAIMAEADDAINDKERQVFYHIFAVKTSKISSVNDIFENREKRKHDLDKYISILELLTRENDVLQESSMENLFKIAVADSNIGINELDLLKKIADGINMDAKTFERLKKQFLPKPKDIKMQIHYDVLGLPYDASLSEIRSKWKKLIMIYHPDKLTNATSKELKMATKRMAEINLAYQTLIKVKGKK